MRMSILRRKMSNSMLWSEIISRGKSTNSGNKKERGTYRDNEKAEDDRRI